MKLPYHLLAALVIGALAWPQQAAAQEFTTCPAAQNTCIVEWATPDGEPIFNALRNTIVNDTARPDGRVYVLRRGGFYYNTDHISNTGFHLRIVGQTAEQGAASGENVCGPAGNEDCGPAVIQRTRREDGTVDGLMLESSGSGDSGFTLRNLWLMGQDDTGVMEYEPITINSSNSRFEIDNVIFDRNEWHHLGFKAGGNKIYIRNSHFRNLAIDDQIWGGRGIRLEAGADSLVFENNSFFNLTSFPVQSEAAPIRYFLFNHNTLVNFGRQFNAGGIWQEAYIANNVMVNPFWHGESQAQYDERLANWVGDGNDPADLSPHIGVFGIAQLPSQYGLEFDRRIVLAHNNAWRSQDIEALYSPLGIRAQPLVSDTTMGWFNLYEGMQLQGNLNLNPGLVSAPTTAEVYNQMGTFLDQWVNDRPSPWAYVYWDPGRPAPGDPLHPISTNWPLPENFSYTNAALQTAGTDNLPLGDLNWFPQAKETYLANREAFVQAIEDLAGAPPEPPATTIVVQAERNAILDNAAVRSVEGETSFFITSGGSITWQFQLAESGTYGLNVQTNMRGESQRGQHIRLNGTGLRNNTGFGEYYFCTPLQAGCADPLPNNEWATVEIRQGGLIAEQSEALMLEAGTHTLQIAPSWGYQGFAGVEVVDAAGNVVANLTPPMATAVGVQEICEGDGYCPSGFQWVEIDAGGSVTWTMDVPEGIGSGLLRLFYQAAAGSMGTVLVNGEEQLSLSFPATGEDTNEELATSRFALAPGPQQITVTSSTGGLNLDYGILLGYAGTVSNEPGALPEGYALSQNYPNPFNGRTVIQYELGATSAVTLNVYDMLGRRVATLVDGVQHAGPHVVQFDTNGLASGAYLYRLQTPVGQQVRRMMVVK